jgi:hypothetical protein
MARNSRSRIESELVQRCALKHEVSPRAVRNWRARNDERWIDFLKSQAAPDLTPLEAVALRADLESSSPEEEERSATRRYLLLQRDLDTAIERGQLSAASPLARAASDAHKFLTQVRSARLEYEVARGALIPAREVAALRTRVLQPLHQVMANMPAEAGPRCNSFDADFAIRALQEWLADRFTPQLDEAMRAIDAVSAP